MTARKHGGNLTALSRESGIPQDSIIDFSANINPLGFPDWLRGLVSSILGSIVHYPDPSYSGLIAAAADRYGINPENIIAGNGSTEILHLIPHAVDARRAVIPVPTYSDYEESVRAAGLDVVKLALEESEDFRLDWNRLQSMLRGGDIVFLCSPNNPTGLLLDAEKLRCFIKENPSTFFVVDEAFGDFVEGFSSLTRDLPSNAAVLLSLTKIYAIPGIRLGLAVLESGIAEAIRKVQPTWSVNTFALAIGQAALRDREYREKSKSFVTECRRALYSELASMPGLHVYPGTANFLLIRLDTSLDSAELGRKLLQQGIAIRDCSNFDGLDSRFVRVAVRTPEENEKLIAALGQAMGPERSVQPRIRKKPALMFQGTSSNAGKSVLTAALCRILLQEGFRVAPFKSQNMSLNSFVTRAGGEMGRAQVVQAQACRLDPDVRMNPILLKPNTDTGSQVIVNGKPVGNMNVMEYVRYKPVAFEKAKAAYDSLADEFDVIVLEGAGSPAEVNLKHHDIVNMPMARYAESPVILVGDIDRGGVFASFVGTMEVLSEWERAQVAGFLVNRFRGDPGLLQDALDYTYKHTGRETFGIVPYFHNLGLPEEDSVTFKSISSVGSANVHDAVEIAVIDLPHISNFTDFDAFHLEPDVKVTIVRSAAELNHPDAVILPGSKNVIGDLDYLRHAGIADKIGRLIQNGTELIGICGGFQMIGSVISDPHQLESSGKTMNGLGFLDVTTLLALEKTLTRAEGVHLASGLPVRGYEIHHGLTECTDTEPLIMNDQGRTDGAMSSNGQVWGTYFHGIFDADEFRRWFIDRLLVRKGLAPKCRICAVYDLEPALDRLAEAVRASIRMEKIYKLMGL
jgi:cobyric acid synthase CobQ/L-threonine-O-3-phosphate decarboxylase